MNPDHSQKHEKSKAENIWRGSQAEYYLLVIFTYSSTFKIQTVVELRLQLWEELRNRRQQPYCTSQNDGDTTNEDSPKSAARDKQDR